MYIYMFVVQGCLGLGFRVQGQDQGLGLQFRVRFRVQGQDYGQGQGLGVTVRVRVQGYGLGLDLGLGLGVTFRVRVTVRGQGLGLGLGLYGHTVCHTFIWQDPSMVACNYIYLFYFVGYRIYLLLTYCFQLYSSFMDIFRFLSSILASSIYYKWVVAGDLRV